MPGMDALGAGWYPDPVEAGILRWFNGADWTTATAEAPPPPQGDGFSVFSHRSKPAHPGRFMDAETVQRYIARKGDQAPEANPDAADDDPLRGHVVVVTGELEHFVDRAEAWEAIALHGATIGKGVTKKTTMLVVGGFDAHTLRPGATKSSKLLKAEELRRGGQRIEILSEKDLIALLASDRT